MSRRDMSARLRAGAPLLLPLALLYAAFVAVARARGLRRRGEPPRGTRVISIGNIEVGGSGKTPLAMHLLEVAIASGRRTAYVSRGYGSPAARGPHVTLVMPRGGAFPDGVAGIRVLERDGPVPLETEIGDEAALVAERIPRAIMALASAKDRAVRVAARMGAEIVVVDDAFQSWTLARDLDLVLVDAARPVGPGWLLPAGTLREAASALRRADAVVFNGAGGGAEVAAARERAAPWLRPGVAVLGMRRSLEMAEGDPPARAFVAAGIARPERFAADLAATGIVVTGSRVFPDHHRFIAGDVARIEAEARACGADAVVVTEKDWVKLRRFVWTMPVRVARLRVELDGVMPDGWQVP